MLDELGVMDYIRFGRTGLEVSQLCLGTWMFGTDADGREVVDRATAHALLDAAWDCGINFFDTANRYGRGRSERYIGEWLADKERENFIVASKVFFTTHGRPETGLSRKIVLSEIDGTLERLGTDYLDIYYIHGWHEGAPLDETLSALNDLVRLGKVHYLGVSNFAAWQLTQAQWIADVHDWESISVIQPRYNAVDHVPYTVDPAVMPLFDLFDACRDQGVAVCPYSPLAEGFLAGRYERTQDGEVIVPKGSRGAMADGYGRFPERWWRVLSVVRAVAEELNATPAQVALRWSMTIDGLTSVPVVGGRSTSQLKDNVATLRLSLSADQYDRISAAGSYEGFESPYTYTG